MPILMMVLQMRIGESQANKFTFTMPETVKPMASFQFQPKRQMRLEHPRPALLPAPEATFGFIGIAVKAHFRHIRQGRQRHGNIQLTEVIFDRQAL